MDKLDMKLGIVGIGNMGKALLAGIAASGALAPSSIYVTDTHREKAELLSQEFGVIFSGLEFIVPRCDVVILAVKPDDARKLLDSYAGAFGDACLIISIAAGLSTQEMLFLAGSSKKIIRAMPNTAVKVREGMTAVCRGGGADDKDIKKALAIFSCVGKTIEVEEKNMDAVVGVSGSSPAFIFQVIEAMADAGVRAGLKRRDAVFLSSQAVLGAAKMVLETGLHPGELKDMVTSPGGTTIEGVYAIENGGVRSAFMDAVKAAADRSEQMSDVRRPKIL